MDIPAAQWSESDEGARSLVASSASISDGVAERELCVGTPGINIHAQAEPDWMPVWYVSGDEAEWRSIYADDAGCPEHGDRRSVEASPDRLGSLPTLNVWMLSCGVMKYHEFTPNDARALQAILREWLLAVDSNNRDRTGGGS